MTAATIHQHIYSVCHLSVRFDSLVWYLLLHIFYGLKKKPPVCVSKRGEPCQTKKKEKFEMNTLQHSIQHTAHITQPQLKHDGAYNKKWERYGEERKNSRINWLFCVVLPSLPARTFFHRNVQKSLRLVRSQDILVSGNISLATKNRSLSKQKCAFPFYPLSFSVVNAHLK